MKLSENLRKALADATDAARDAWTAAEELKDAAASADLTTDEGKASLDAFEKAHEAYQEKEQTCVELRGRYERALDADSKEAPRPLELPAPANGNGNGSGLTVVKTPGDRFIESDGYKALVASGALRAERARITSTPVEVWTQQEVKNLLERKADLITSADGSGGTLIQPDRLSAVLPFLTRPIRVLDLVNRTTTTSDTIEWVRVSGWTNAAAEVAEAIDLATGTKPQSDIDFELVTSPVRTIAHWVAATRQVLMDAPRLRDFIDQTLQLGILLRLETQVVSGNGTPPNLLGILNTPGIQSIPAVAGTSPVDAIYAGIAAVRAKFLEPTAVVVNPADWGAIRLSKATDGSYYYGPPNIAGPETIFGVPVVQSSAIPAGDALVGDFRQATLWTREGVVVIASSEHADFFIKNLVAVLAEGRWAFGISYPEAFALVDLAVLPLP